MRIMCLEMPDVEKTGMAPKAIVVAMNARRAKEMLCNRSMRNGKFWFKAEVLWSYDIKETKEKVLELIL